VSTSFRRLVRRGGVDRAAESTAVAGQRRTGSLSAWRDRHSTQFGGPVEPGWSLFVTSADHYAAVTFPMMRKRP
jgi:hypothetical protein